MMMLGFGADEAPAPASPPNPLCVCSCPKPSETPLWLSLLVPVVSNIAIVTALWHWRRVTGIKSS